MTTSRIPHFYNLPLDQRMQKIAEASGVNLEDLDGFNVPNLETDQADHMVENAIGAFGLPLGIALNFIVNGEEVLIPMAIEEPSVIAGASFMAKLTRKTGGFSVEVSPPEMIGQIQVLDLRDLEAAKENILQCKQELQDEAGKTDPILAQLGGGPRDLEVRTIHESPIGPFMVIHLIFDVRDAMGANAVNTACEKIAPSIEKITGGRVHLKILSNLADRRLVKARCTIPTTELSFISEGASPSEYPGEAVRDGIISAWAFAAADPYRAATHNKGIMNGVDAVVVATGNDWRAIEAGAHAYAARLGRYTSLSTWYKDNEGNLAGVLEMPMAVGIVGGATRVHPAARAALKLMRVKTASELAGIIAAVGLAQNLAALRALSTEGIQRGHMGLHARQVAIAAGAKGELIDKIAAKMVAENCIRVDKAEEFLKSE